MIKTAVAMSGGVDSSAAVLKILEQGHDVVGVTLKLFSEADVSGAKETAAVLGISHRVYDCTEDFRRFVTLPFAKAYAAGETPNPCVECNKYLKFGRLLELVRADGFDFLATGHYARVEKTASGRFLLKKALDASKDQSYVLYSLTQECLAHVLFPLGEMSKPQARVLARENSLQNYDAPESQDICFVPDGNYRDFIERLLGQEFPDGDFVDLEGKVRGRHKGIIGYTIGQRKGLGIAAPAPLFVVRKDVPGNRVLLGSESDLYSKTLIAKDLNFIPFDSFSGTINIAAKTRYRQKEAPATARLIDSDRLLVEFDEPQRAVTPGQALVIYDGDCVVGGGTIE